MSLKIHAKNDVTLKSKTGNVVVDAGYMDVPELHLTTPLDQSYIDLSGVAMSADLSAYLTTSSASSTYQTQSGMSSYLTTSSASSTYLTQSNASSTYLTQSNASSTYQPIASMSSYLTTSSASTNYLTKSQASTDYLTIADASSNYQPIGDYLETADLSGYVQSANLQSDIAGLDHVSVDELRIPHSDATKQEKRIVGSVSTEDDDVGNVLVIGVNPYEYVAVSAVVSVKTNEGNFNTYEVKCTGKRTASGSAVISTDTQVSIINEEDSGLAGVSAIADGNDIKIQWEGKTGVNCDAYCRADVSVLNFD